MSPIYAAVLRVILVFGAGLALILAVPHFVLTVMTPLAGILTDVTFPYMDATRLDIDGDMLHVHGELNINIIGIDGSVLPTTPAHWQKLGHDTLHILLVALAVWAMPPMPWRRRLLGLPLVLLACLVVAGYDLTVQIQDASLTVIGTQWLPSMLVAPVEENIAVFTAMESRYITTKWVKVFNDAGGRLFLSVLCGLAGLFLPDMKRPPTVACPAVVPS